MALSLADRALSDLLIAHGLVMNGGVDHAVEALSVDELVAAAAGYRFFGFDAAATLLEEVAAASIDDDETLDERYAAIIPDDSTLFDRFADVFASSPNLFAPV